MWHALHHLRAPHIDFLLLRNSIKFNVINSEALIEPSDRDLWRHVCQPHHLQPTGTQRGLFSPSRWSSTESDACADEGSHVHPSRTFHRISHAGRSSVYWHSLNREHLLFKSTLQSRVNQSSRTLCRTAWRRTSRTTQLSCRTDRLFNLSSQNIVIWSVLFFELADPYPPKYIF